MHGFHPKHPCRAAWCNLLHAGELFLRSPTYLVLRTPWMCRHGQWSSAGGSRGFIGQSAGELCPGAFLGAGVPDQRQVSPLWAPAVACWIPLACVAACAAACVHDPASCAKPCGTRLHVMSVFSVLKLHLQTGQQQESPEHQG